jgi:hypothetical protein
MSNFTDFSAFTPFNNKSSNMNAMDQDFLKIRQERGWRAAKRAWQWVL